MKSSLALIALAVSLCPAAFGQSKPLVRTHTIPTTLTFDSNPSYALPTACDDKGRSYVKLIEPDGKMTGPVRVSDKGVIEAQFDTTQTLDNTFAVRPDSGIAAVHRDGKTDVIDNFAPDGARGSQVRLETPPVPFFPMQIAVFPSGGFFLAGQPYRQGYENPSAAVYDAEGHLIKQLNWKGTQDTRQAINGTDDKAVVVSKLARRSVAITGDDGNVYFMRAVSPPSVDVISSTGEIVRKLVVKGPTGANWPDFGLRVVKNKLLVEFLDGCEDPTEISSCHGTLYTVVDATSGERIADFEADQGARGPLACYFSDPDRVYTFSIQPERHRLDIIETVPR